MSKVLGWPTMGGIFVEHANWYISNEKFTVARGLSMIRRFFVSKQF